MQVMCKSKYEARYQKRKMCLVNLYEFQEHRFAQITMPQGNLAKVPVHTLHSTDARTFSGSKRFLRECVVYLVNAQMKTASLFTAFFNNSKTLLQQIPDLPETHG